MFYNTTDVSKRWGVSTETVRRRIKTFRGERNERNRYEQFGTDDEELLALENWIVKNQYKQSEKLTSRKSWQIQKLTGIFDVISVSQQFFGIKVALKNNEYKKILAFLTLQSYQEATKMASWLGKIRSKIEITGVICEQNNRAVINEIHQVADEVCPNANPVK